MLEKVEFAYIAGSAHLDIIADVTENAEVVDKIGSVNYEFGGTAYNFAMNLQETGVQTTFMGAFNQSPVSQMILTEMMNKGIKTHVKIVANLPEAGFCAQLINGDLFSAVSSMPVEQVNFTEKFIASGMDGAKCAILDCNLAENVLNNAAKVAADNNIPIYVAAVSESKCMRALAIKNKVEVIFLNEYEMEFILKSMPKFSSWGEVAKFKNCNFVVTQGSKGVSLCKINGSIKKFDVEAINTEVNTLGAGDMFTSTFIKSHSFDELSLEDSINKGIEAATSVLTRPNASLGRSQAFHDSIESIALRAETDKLTGLLNREGLERFMKSRSLFDKQFFAILCDIDFFKTFNDTYGHDVGDKVLVQVSQVIKKCIRGKDAVGRWGGEEFVCLIDDKKAATAMKIAERIRVEVASLKLDGVDKQITLSAGVALSEPDNDWDFALKDADIALYKAKESGRNKVVYSK